ncbi:hypothetical protein TNCV_1391121 [Trichonephila clavipes]|nr:hypothetical protein TNCV_1391121 [Trichonephila clavipes]
MLNEDEIVTSVYEESDPVDDETDEDKDINNKSSKGPSNADAFSAFETAMETRGQGTTPLRVKENISKMFLVNWAMGVKAPKYIHLQSSPLGRWYTFLKAQMESLLRSLPYLLLSSAMAAISEFLDRTT